MTLEMIKKRFESGLSNFDTMIKRESYFQNITLTKFKMLLLENGYHIEESSFESNFKLRTNDGAYNYLAELLADSNSLSFIFAKFKGKNKASFSERSDYGSQCIILAYEKMKERLKLENICKTITNPRPRKDIYLYDMYAVNEALVNAIIHNDYRVTDPQVAFFDDRLEITSHGGLPNGLTNHAIIGCHGIHMVIAVTLLLGGARFPLQSAAINWTKYHVGNFFRRLLGR